MATVSPIVGCAANGEAGQRVFEEKKKVIFARQQASVSIKHLNIASPPNAEQLCTLKEEGVWTNSFMKV